MKILLITGNWFNCNMAGGGEHYLSRLVEALKPYGHEFKGIAATQTPFTHNGIDFTEQGDMAEIWVKNNELMQWSDVVFTQLLGNPMAYNKCKQFKKPMFFFAHNFSNHYFTDKNTRVVYNSHSLGNLFPYCDSFVRTPLIPYSDPVKGSKIALINCNKAKGTELFNQLAAELPYQFLGVKGAYGDQILSDHVTYQEHSNAVDWSDIKLLLVPSEIESWSQVASESIMRGIPVIASPLPGIKENLSYAGIYIEQNDISLYKETIRWLMESDTIYQKQSELCLKRASEYDNCLDEFNEWLINNSK